MISFTSLWEVGEALPGSLSDRLFLTRGKVVEVHRERRDYIFTLAEGDAQLECILLWRAAAKLDFRVTVGQVLEVTGYADAQNGRLDVMEARLADRKEARLAGRNACSAGQIIGALFGLPKK
jgi:RecJ-like exonuclease